MMDNADIIDQIVPKALPSRPTFETVTRLQVCERIEPERSTIEAMRFEMPLTERWSALTEPLPLAGATAMRPDAKGGFPALDAVAAAMPWAAALVADVARGVRLQLALGRPWVQFEPVLLVGLPGVGKSWLARRLADALHLPSAVLELGNASDDRQLSGTARGWSNAQPAWPVVTIAATRCANPLLVVDEIDKAGGSAQHGRPHHALLSMIEPGSAKRWPDPCLLGACDLSAVNWVACANTIDPIPTALRSRFRVVELAPPDPTHFDAALASVLGDLAARWDLPANLYLMPPLRAVRLLRRQFADHRSIRLLSRHATAIVGAMLTDGAILTRQ
ncbi:AAA family ATPase [Sphingomonas aracearum]|uniref:AAA family ATPase n=1 Tax=Sphingomonas aracearum TaxID=2283317 RepID=A0A369VXV5_9SPHN|nr:AAA family ATPase [Sphingomonas aracearum]RDE05970.1 AAA family ATPase [Sphingomonas aracearum]